MQIRQLSIPDAYEVTPIQRSDERGVFFEWYRHDRLEQAIGHALNLRQANSSTSQKGVVRGIHFADVPIGQAKYVTVTHGAVRDFVIDLRVGSPTFGNWDSVLLDDVDYRAVYVAEGLGHGFVALSQTATVTYLVSDVHRATREHGINPLDEQIGLDFGLPRDELILSLKDLEAPSLAEAESDGLLPTWKSVTDFYSSLNAGTS